MSFKPIPRILEFPGKKIYGLHQSMSLMANTTAELWRKFMEQSREAGMPPSEKLFSIQVFSEGYTFDLAGMTKNFEKWAGVEYPEVIVPSVFSVIEIPPGTYAVFDYDGGPAKAADIFRYIFAEWLPQSAWQVDNRPHFEILPPNYREMKGMVEEEIWIPVSKSNG